MSTEPTAEKSALDAALDRFSLAWEALQQKEAAYDDCLISATAWARERTQEGAWAAESRSAGNMVRFAVAQANENAAKASLDLAHEESKIAWNEYSEAAKVLAVEVVLAHAPPGVVVQDGDVVAVEATKGDVR